MTKITRTTETRHFSGQKTLHRCTGSRRSKPWPLSESIFDRFDITLLLISGQNGSHYPNNASRVRLSDRKRKLRRYGCVSSNFRPFVRRIGATIRRQATRKIGKMAALLRPVVSQAIQFSMTRGFSRLLRDIEADCCSTRASV